MKIAHQPGSEPLTIPEQIPNPAVQPAPPPHPERQPDRKEPVRVPEKVPANRIDFEIIKAAGRGRVPAYAIRAGSSAFAGAGCNSACA